MSKYYEVISGLYETVSPNKGMGILRKKLLKSGTEEHLIGRLESSTFYQSLNQARKLKIEFN